MKKARITLFATLLMILAFSSITYAKKKKYDLPNMTSSQLEALKDEINEELSANHKTTSDQESAVEAAVKAFVENEYGTDNVEWAWFDYTYTKEWDFYTMATHADITKHDGGKAEYAVYSEVVLSGDNCQVVYVKIGEEELYNERSAKVTDERIRKMLGLEDTSASGETSADDSSAEQSADSTPETEAVIAKRGDKNDDVLAIQQMLARLGYLSTTPDGAFGERTEGALNQFKTDHGFAADGIVTQSVYDALKAAADAAPEPEQVISISAVDLYTQFDSNAIAAETAYTGKLVQVSGTVGSIDKDLWGNPYVTLNADQYGFSGVNCYFSGDNVAPLASLTAGQSVTIKGTCGEMSILYVEVKDCTIVG